MTKDNIELHNNDPNDTNNPNLNVKELLDGIPVEIAENVPHLLNRVNAYLAYYAALNLSRLNHLSQYIVQAEERLYDPESIYELEVGDLQKNYKSAKSSSMEILEFARRVSQQIQQDSSDVDQVVNLLKALSPEDLDNLRTHLED